MIQKLKFCHETCLGTQYFMALMFKQVRQFNVGAFKDAPPTFDDSAG